MGKDRTGSCILALVESRIIFKVLHETYGVCLSRSASGNAFY